VAEDRAAHRARLHPPRARRPPPHRRRGAARAARRGFARRRRRRADGAVRATHGSDHPPLARAVVLAAPAVAHAPVRLMRVVVVLAILPLPAALALGAPAPTVESYRLAANRHGVGGVDVRPFP